MTAIEGTLQIDRQRMRPARQGRISGCPPGKPLEVLSFQRRPHAIDEYLRGQVRCRCATARRWAGRDTRRDGATAPAGVAPAAIRRVATGSARRPAGFILAALVAAVPWASVAAAHLADRTEYRAPRADVAPVVDGVAGDPAWSAAPWHEIDQLWLGPEYSAADFRARFKVVWTPERIYMLVELIDDVLFDRHRNPLVHYWDDDSLEIFIDEDFSGGNHQFNHNAFAYHVSLDNQAVDIGTDRRPRSYPEHVASRWQQHDDRIVWELAIGLYPDGYQDDSPVTAPVPLAAGKVIGLMVAYCDNDGSEYRENFVGSEAVPFDEKDRGWIDADLFGKLVLDAPR